jgi:hypothetical protein
LIFEQQQQQLYNVALVLEGQRQQQVQQQIINLPNEAVVDTVVDEEGDDPALEPGSVEEEDDGIVLEENNDIIIIQDCYIIRTYVRGQSVYFFWDDFLTIRDTGGIYINSNHLTKSISNASYLQSSNDYLHNHLDDVVCPQTTMSTIRRRLHLFATSTNVRVRCTFIFLLTSDVITRLF